MIGELQLGAIPGIVAVIDKIILISKLLKVKEAGADIFEIRADLFHEKNEDILDFVKAVRHHVMLPQIITIRKTEDNDSKRFALFKQIEPYVDAVDIEIDADIRDEVLNLFSSKIKIVSEHDFERTPDEDELISIVEKAGEIGADIIKIATMAQNNEDVVRLLTFLHSRKENLVVIAMGEIGKISRIAAPLFGSLLVYTSISEAVAPGQLSLDFTVNELEQFYPVFKKRKKFIKPERIN